MSLVSFLRDKVKAVLTSQSEAVLEVSIIDPANPNNRIVPNASGQIAISGIVSPLSSEVTQDTHDDLNANTNIQVGNSDVPGGAGIVTVSTPRITLASNDSAVTDIASILSQLDITLSGLRDAIRGASTKDFTTLEADIEIISGKLPATLGQKASAASLSGVLSTEQETILTALRTALEIIDNIVAGNEAQVDIVTSALPAGAATEVTLGSVKTAVEVIDNMISGNEGQVDVVTLPQAASVPYGTVVVSVTATAQQLPSNVAKQGVILVANELNDAANIIYLGFSNTVTNATYFKQLLPGEATPLLPVTNSNVSWVYCVFTGGTHSYNYGVF
jgi:hypothetical protein